MGDFSPSSLKHRLKHSIYGCFKHNNNDPNQHHRLDDHLDPYSPQCGGRRRLMRSTSGGAKGMVRHLIHRIGNGNGTPRYHRRSKSTDFHYDPLSYTLNFDDDDNASFQEFRFRNFSDRLPPSPSPAPAPAPHLPRPRSDTAVAAAVVPPSEITAACS